MQNSSQLQDRHTGQQTPPPAPQEVGTKRRLLRTVLRLISKISYSARVFHPEHVPATGGALLVSNHISFVDLLLVLAASPRFARFLMPADICAIWWLKPFMRWMDVIPLPPSSETKDMLRTLHRAKDLIRSGEVIGIFPENNISRIGALLPFGHEFERIMEGLDAPIIPVCLDGLWGSVFSFHQRRFFWKWPRRLAHPVTITFGNPLPASTKAFQVRSVIQELNTDAWANRRDGMHPLHRSFVRRARRFPWRFAMADARTARVSFGGALVKTVFLARRLRAHWTDQEMVGILLPPSVAGALANWAALLLGKVPVNLNYTLSEEPLSSCVRQCNLQTVLTSKAFLDKVKTKVPCRTLLLEEVAAQPRFTEKLLALLMTMVAPASMIEKLLGRKAPATLDDPATVIFSSGSTGDPKGIVLTHYNIVSNAEQLYQLLDFSKRDRVLGVLPFFHSFGFTGTLTSPGILGVGVVFHPTPLDPRAVADLVRRYSITYLIATPTFLQIYLRGCEPADFGSLRSVVLGAEKLPEWLANAFEDKFGLRPMEAYGCTECAPVVTCSTHEFRAPGFRQKGSRRGSTGLPLPGVSVRIVSPETGERLEAGEPGLLLVRGPNVMAGYLGQPQKTAEVLRDGWYVTGDIATIDDEGFLKITDRLSRFSKIGGEMVPHVTVEEKLHQALGTSETVVAVCGVPDAKKGERLVVLHTLPDERLAELLKKLPELGLPNLWVPRPNQFFRVETLPLLATGKRDLRSMRDMANRLSADDKNP